MKQFSIKLTIGSILDKDFQSDILLGSEVVDPIGRKKVVSPCYICYKNNKSSKEKT